MPRAKNSSGAILVLLMLLGPGYADAQTEPALGSDSRVGAAFSARSGVTWLSGRPLPTAAIAGTLRLSSTVELGGEGVFGLGAIRLSPEVSPDRSELRTGYGGVVLRWRPAGDVPGVRWGGGLLVGAGAARIQSPLADAEIFTENYFLVEPRVGLLLRQDRSVRPHAEAAYRIVLGADPLPGIRVTELRGPSLSVGVQYVRDP